MTLRLALLIAAAWLVYLLWIPPAAGIADNGDFARLIAPFGLEHSSTDPAQKYFNYVDTDYQWTANRSLVNGLYPLRSSESVAIAAALAIAPIVSKTGGFDIRMIGTIHALLLLGLVALFWPLLAKLPAWKCRLFAALAWIIFADSGYVIYFNTFYSETMIYLSLLALSGFCLRAIGSGTLDRFHATGVVLASLFLVTSKAQMTLVAPIVGGYVAWLFLRLGADRKLAWGSLILILVAGGLSYWTYPAQYRRVNLFMTVFGGVLANSPDQAADFTALGLNPSLLSYQNKNVWSAEVDVEGPYLNQNFFQKISYASVIGFYLQRPARFLNLVEAGIDASFSLKHKNIGELEKLPGTRPGQANSGLALWSALMARLRPISGMIVVLGTCAIAWLVFVTRMDEFRWLQLVLAACSLAAFLTAIIGEGPSDLSKHLFPFRLPVDMLLFWFFVCLTNRAEQLVRAGRAGFKNPPLTLPTGEVQSLWSSFSETLASQHVQNKENS